MILIIFLIAALIFAGWCVYRDQDSSKDFIYYGQHEGNDLFKNAHGYTNFTTSTIVYGLTMAGLSALIFSPYAIAAPILLILFGLYHLLAAKKNEKGAKERRLTQISILRAIKDLPNDSAIATAKTLQLYYAPNGEVSFFYFGWIGTSHQPDEQAKEELAPILVALSQKPEAEWFPK